MGLGIFTECLNLRSHVADFEIFTLMRLDTLESYFCRLFSDVTSTKRGNPNIQEILCHKESSKAIFFSKK